MPDTNAIVTPEDPMDNEKVNTAANSFMNGLPRVKALASNMKAGALGRVFNAVMEFPLAENYPRFRSKAENELFIMSLSLLQAKNMMVAAVAASQKQSQEVAEAAIQDAAQAVADDAALQPDLTIVEPKEDSNG